MTIGNGFRGLLPPLLSCFVLLSGVLLHAAPVDPQKPKEQLKPPVEAQNASSFVSSDQKAPVADEQDPTRPFGYSFFDASSKAHDYHEHETFRPAPAQYPLGIGDVIEISLISRTGQETNLDLQLDSLGRIRIPNLGFVKVSGLTIQQAESAIGAQVSSKFPGLRTQVSMGQMSPIQVFVAGEVKAPGSYVLPAMSSLLNALVKADGIRTTGSLRNIVIERNQKNLANVDLYEFLLHGNRKQDIILQSGDSVFVKAIGPTVTIEGKVRRPAIYELKGTTDVRQALAMAGGVDGNASLAAVRVERTVGGLETHIVDLALTRPASDEWGYVLQNGDRLQVRGVLADAANRVTVNGKVKRPGEYELGLEMKVSDLVTRAEGFTDDEIYLERATIFRLQEDGRLELLSVHLGKAMLKDPDEDILLRPKDRLVIYSVLEAAAQDRKVWIAGEVAREGLYERREGMRVRDLIVAAGGAKPEAHSSIELARTKEDSNGNAALMTLNLQRVMDGIEGDNLPLEDGDQISVRSVREYRRIADTVVIKGEVKYPGTYALSYPGEPLTSVVARAGGLTDQSFPEGAVLQRRHRLMGEDTQVRVASATQLGLKTITERIRDLRLAKAGVTPPPATAASAAKGIAGASQVAGATASLDSAATSLAQSRDALLAPVSMEQERTVEQVVDTRRLPIDLPAAMQDTEGDANVGLEAGDTITVPRRPTVVAVAGAVLNPTVVLYKSGLGVKDYVKLVGDYSKDADRGNTVIVRANGQVFTEKNAGKIQVGDIIIVSPKAMTPPRSGWDFIADTAKIFGQIALPFAILAN